MNKKILITLLSLLSINSYAVEYEVIGGSKYNNNEIFFTKADSNTKMETFYKNGKIYLAGNVGDKYEINLCGNSRAYGNSIRNLYVISVDGLNVISGEPANYNQSGYVISNSENCSKIKGWRKNMNEEARFYITSISNSYAARTDNNQRNVGVIGIALFNEYKEPKPLVYESSERKFNAMPSSTGGSSLGASASVPMDSSESVPSPSIKKEIMHDRAMQEKVGTGHGERIVSEARKTEFKKASDKPFKIVQVYYDTYDNLISKGIITVRNDQPNAFPGETKFAPEPKH